MLCRMLDALGYPGLNRATNADRLLWRDRMEARTQLIQVFDDLFTFFELERSMTMTAFFISLVKFILHLL